MESYYFQSLILANKTKLYLETFGVFVSNKFIILIRVATWVTE